MENRQNLCPFCHTIFNTNNTDAFVHKCKETKLNNKVCKICNQDMLTINYNSHLWNEHSITHDELYCSLQ